MVKINAKRLLGDLQALRSYGAQGDGVVRLALSAEDMAARRWLQGRMIEAGLDATIDGIGNVFGRSRKAGPAILVGSHSDTQPSGGWLDGAYGVICGARPAEPSLLRIVELLPRDGAAAAEGAANTAAAAAIAVYSLTEGARQVGYL